jgi:hypothetical protein
MTQIEESKTGRRQFFIAVGRVFAVGGMVAYGVVQAIKARRLKNDPNCIRLYTCDQCVEFASGCKLPKAEEFRKETAGL